MLKYLSLQLEGRTAEEYRNFFISYDNMHRVAKCHRFGRYICVKVLKGWGKKWRRLHSYENTFPPIYCKSELAIALKSFKVIWKISKASSLETLAVHHLRCTNWVASHALHHLWCITWFASPSSDGFPKGRHQTKKKCFFFSEKLRNSETSPPPHLS